MDSIQLSTLAALAGKWQTEADCGAGSADRRAALRECADTVRMLCEVRFEDCPHAAPHRYCAECPVSPCPIALGEHAVAKRGAVPEGYDIAPTFRGYAKLGSGRYVLHNCPRTDEDHPSLVIAIATEEEKAGRQVGELRQSQPGLMIQPERIAVRIDFKSVAALDALEQQLRFLREDSFPDSLATPAADQFHDAAEMVPEFSDSARAALLWVLWHHQGGSSPIGQPIRFALGIGQHERLSDWQVAEAKRWGELRGEPKTAKCDGNHGGPRCADPECWQDPVDDVIDVRTAAERLVKRALAVGVVLTIETEPRQPLAMGNYDLLVQTREARKGGAA